MHSPNARLRADAETKWEDRLLYSRFRRWRNARARAQETPAPAAATPSALPDGLRIFAIGDIHGCLDAFNDLLAKIEDDVKKSPVDHWQIITLGDYLDRGPSSKQVVDRLIGLTSTHGLIALKGNHDVWLSDFIERPELFSAWEPWGAAATLLSYGVDAASAPGLSQHAALAAELGQVIPPEHIDFLKNLPCYHLCGDYLFVHAGLRPGIALSDQSEADLIGIRQEFLRHHGQFEKFVIHGHTPVVEPDVRSNRINIDTGAYATHRLTCLVLEGASRRFLHSGPDASSERRAEHRRRAGKHAPDPRMRLDCK
jgi:serine/threonine protein phosphatase 1